MSYVHRVMVVPAKHVDLARALAAGLSGPAGTGMWTRGLSPDGTAPATHYINAGQIGIEFAALMPLKTYSTGDDGTETCTVVPGDAETIAAAAEMPLAVITALLDAAEVTEEEAEITLARVKLQFVADGGTE